ncbi:MAG: PAS domain-containing protein [Planctomycetota bacterium]
MSLELSRQWRKTSLNLTRSEVKFRGLVETSSDWIWEVNAKGIYTYASPQVENILGYKPQEVVGKTPFSLMPPEEAQRVAGIFKDLIEAGKPIVTLENVNLHKDGRRITLETSGVPLFDEAGKVTGYRGVDRDVTDRKQTEVALQKSGAMLSRAQKIAHVGSWNWDFISGELTWSDELYRIAGIPHQQVTWELSQKIVHPDDRNTVLNMYEAVSSGEGFINGSFRIVRPDGDVRHVYNEGEVILDDTDTPVRTFGVMHDITERKEAEDKLKESEEKYRLLIENADALIAFLDVEGRFLFLNSQAAMYLGIKAKDIIGKSIYEIMPEEADFHMQRLTKIMNERKRTIFEDLLKLPYGQRWFSSNIQPVIDQDGNVRGVQIISTDITERKRAERELQESESKFRSITENAVDFIFIKDKARRYTFVNQAMQEMLGLPKEKILGKTPEDIFGSEQGHIVKEVDDRTFSGETVNEIRSLVIGDKELFFNTIQTPLTRADGEVTSITGIVRDITDHKQAEQQLRSLEERFSKAFRVSPDTIIITRLSDGLIIDVNVAFEEMFQIPTEKAVGRTSVDLNLWQDPAKRDHLVALMRQDRTVRDVEIRARRSSGELFDALYSAEIIEIAGQTCILSIIHDITELRRAEEKTRQIRTELERTDRISIVGEMASGLAHELNQPLCAILNYANVCQRITSSKTKGGRELLEAVGHIASQADRAGKILRNIRTLVSRRQPHLSTVDINDVIQNVIGLIQHELTASGVTVEMGLADDVPLILADEVQIEQVVLNLVRNSLEAMSDMEVARRHLTIHTSLDKNDLVRITVRDKGKGIPPKEAEKIFESFFTTKDGGLGVGLSISRSIIEEHGGKLWAQPKPDGGATLHFTLPLKGKQNG